MCCPGITAAVGFYWSAAQPNKSHLEFWQQTATKIVAVLRLTASLYGIEGGRRFFSEYLLTESASAGLGM